MSGLATGLLQAGLALKINQIKRAATSYARDRAEQGQGIVASYAVAAGLYAAAGIFLIAALLVGITALFRWIELNYGTFQAFGAIGGLLFLIAMVCAGVAASRLKRPTKQFPSLTSRLRVALKANPVASDQIEAVRDTAAGILMTPSATRTNRRRMKTQRRPARNNREIGAGLILAATLLGWAATRRRQQAPRTEA